MKATFEMKIPRILQQVNPDVYDECLQLATPPVCDVAELPAIMGHLVSRNKPIPENIPFIIAVTYFLTAPYKLVNLSIRLNTGIRGIISNKLRFENEEMVNHYSAYLIPNWKNPRFRAKVKAEAETIMQLINYKSINY